MSLIDMLQKSYQSDIQPFLTTPVNFLSRAQNSDEIRLLRQILFPVYWNGFEIVKSKEKLEQKFGELQSTFVAGVSSYGASSTCCE